MDDESVYWDSDEAVAAPSKSSIGGPNHNTTTQAEVTRRQVKEARLQEQQQQQAEKPIPRVPKAPLLRTNNGPAAANQGITTIERSTTHDVAEKVAGSARDLASSANRALVSTTCHALVSTTSRAVLDNARTHLGSDAQVPINKSSSSISKACSAKSKVPSDAGDTTTEHHHHHQQDVAQESSTLEGNRIQEADRKLAPRLGRSFGERQMGSSRDSAFEEDQSSQSESTESGPAMPSILTAKPISISSPVPDTTGETTTARAAGSNSKPFKRTDIFDIGSRVTRKGKSNPIKGVLVSRSEEKLYHWIVRWDDGAKEELSKWKLKGDDTPATHTMISPAAGKASGASAPSSEQPSAPTTIIQKKRDAKLTLDLMKTCTTTAAATMPRPSQKASPATVKAAKLCALGSTTARHRKKAKIKIAVGIRVFVPRRILYTCGRLNKQQKDCVQKYAKNYRFYGTVRGGNGTRGYTVAFDLLPSGHKKVNGLQRRSITTLLENSEESQMPEGVEDLSQVNADKPCRKKTPMQQSISDFLSFSKDDLKEAKMFEMKLDSTENNTIKWEILGDGVDIVDDPMIYPTELPLKKNIDFDSEPLAEIFFRDFFPSVEGHASLMDEYFENSNVPFGSTVAAEKIRFHQPDDRDPDWIIKQCYLLVIAAATEPEIGVTNLWKRGMSGGRHEHANFGKYIPENTFKAFVSAAALMFADKQWWYAPSQDVDWEVFTPVLEGYSQRRQELFKCVLILLDESMSAWRPKTSKTGDLPNISSEPSKPRTANLGTQFKNAVECLSGCLVYQDIVMGPERQRLKPYFYADSDALEMEKSSLPLNPDIQAHVSEVLRQVEGAGVQHGGWCGGDAWFGSVMSSVELYTRRKVHSTFVIKSNTHLFPMDALHAILSARHGEHPAGHWVVMTTSISGVKLIAIGYAWSQRGVSYFISTCGRTVPHAKFYEAKYEDVWGNTCSRYVCHCTAWT